jgi:beta-galactosidase
MKKIILSASLWLLPLWIWAQLTSSVRVVQPLDAGWRFQKGSGSLALGGKDAADPPSFADWAPVHLPHTWNAEDVVDEAPGYYRGEAWYQRTLDLPLRLRGKRLFVYFEAANQLAKVYLNGQLMGEHRGGYTAFAVDITAAAHFEGPNSLLVQLSNASDPDIPPLSADFTFFGGLYRQVYLLATEPVHFSLGEVAGPGLYAQTPQVSKTAAQIKLVGSLQNHHPQSRRLRLQGQVKDPRGRVVTTFDQPMRATKQGETPFELELPAIEQPQLWSPESPQRYAITAQIRDARTDSLLDELRLPLGLRWFRFSADSGFFLNGKPYKLIGVNRHQDFAGLGNAVPASLQRRDIELIKQMGANFLRIAHYPQHPAVLEMCDRLGILTSVEIPIVNRITESEAFYETCLQMQREMIWQNYNHPSVVVWAYMNEVLLRPPFDP